jgi:hypothetical protein
MSLDSPHKSKAPYFKVFKVVEQREGKYYPIHCACNYYTKDCNYGWELDKVYEAGQVIPLMNAYALLVNGNGWDTKKMGYLPSFHAYKNHEYARHTQGYLEKVADLPYKDNKEYRIVRAIFSGSLYEMNMRRHYFGTKPEVAGTKMRITEVLPYENGRPHFPHEIDPMFGTCLKY